MIGPGSDKKHQQQSTNNMVDHLEVSSTGGRRAAVQSLEKANRQNSQKKLVFLNLTCAPTKPSSKNNLESLCFLYMSSLMMREKHIGARNYVGGYCKGGWGHLSSISLIDLIRPESLGVFYLLIREYRYILISWKYCHIHLLSSLSSEHDIEVFLKLVQQPYFAWLCQMCLCCIFCFEKFALAGINLLCQLNRSLHYPGWDQRELKPYCRI